MPGRDPRSLEDASEQSRQSLAPLNPWIVQELDTEARLEIEVNGVLVASLPCLEQALAELAAGWAFLHRFIVRPQDFARSTADAFHASVMSTGGLDIDARLAVYRGELHERTQIPEPYPRDEEWTIPEDVLLDIAREAFAAMRGDRAAEGYIHASLASGAAVEVIAADLTTEIAVCKVLGWALMRGEFPTHEILIVNGAVTRAMVEAAARLGVKVIVTAHVPTADAWRMARVVGVSLVGYARHKTAGLFVNNGAIDTAST